MQFIAYIMALKLTLNGAWMHHHTMAEKSSVDKVMYIDGNICMHYIFFFHVTVSCCASKDFSPSQHHSYFIFTCFDSSI